MPALGGIVGTMGAAAVKNDARLFAQVPPILQSIRHRAAHFAHARLTRAPPTVTLRKGPDVCSIGAH